MLTVNLAIQLVLLIALGLFVGKRKLVDAQFAGSITSFILNIALPCVIVNSFQVEYAPEALRRCGVALALSLGLMAFLALLGQGGFYLFGRGATARVFRFGTIFSNFTFVGLPVVEALYGGEGLFYFVMMLLPFRMVYYSAARPLLRPPGVRAEGQSWAARLKDWFSPPVVAVFVGLFLYITQIRLPEALADTVSTVGSVCTSMGMVVCGITLAKYDMKSLLRPRFLWLPLMRNLIVPALTALVLLALPVEPLLARILVVFAALPVASLVVAYTLQYDPESQAPVEGAGAVLLSTLLSAVTIPLWAAVAGWLFPG